MDSALQLQKPPSVSGWMAASLPPAMMASALEYFIARYASPTVLVLVAQAETGARQGPLAPVLMAVLPAPRLEISIGTKSGEIRLAPSSLHTRVWSMKVLRPPMQEPM